MEYRGELPELRGMEMRCREAAAAFRGMSRGSPGAKDALEALARQELENASMLRGMRVLSGEEPEVCPCREVASPGLRRGLALAYRRSLAAARDYGAWRHQESFGPAFQMLEQKEAATQGRILMLL